MSVNRFRRVAPVLDPTMYMYQERLQLPDLSGIGKLTSALQTSYDSKVPKPQHIQGDAELVNQYFVKPVEDLKSSAVEAFKKGDTSAGVNYMKQMEQFIYNSKQPGGAFHAFEDTYSRASQYQKSIRDNKDISKDTQDFSINKSLSGFKTFDDKGNRNEFSGYIPAKDVDMNDYFTKLAKDWAETEFVKGYQKTMNGQYFDQRSGKVVSKDEIVKSLSSAWMNNPDIAPYVKQLSEMYGAENAQARVLSAINLAAEKEAFTSEESKLVGNKDYDLSNQLKLAKYKKSLEDTEETTTGLLAPFKNSPFPSKSVDIKDGKIQTGTKEMVTNVPSQFGGSAGYGVPKSAPVYDNRGFNQMVQDPKMKSYFDERPGLKTVIEQTPATGMKPSEYNKLITARYESMQKTTDVSLAYQSLSSKQRKDINGYLLGENKDDLGAIVNHSVSVLSNGKSSPIVISPKELAQNKDKINFYAKSEGGNGYFPGAIFGTYNKGKDGVFNIVVEPISYETSQHYKGLKALSQPTTTRMETGWQQVNIPGKGLTTIKSKPVLIFDGNNLQDVELEFFVPDANGKEQKVNGMNKANLQALFETTAPGNINTTTVIK